MRTLASSTATLCIFCVPLVDPDIDQPSIWLDCHPICAFLRTIMVGAIAPGTTGYQDRGFHMHNFPIASACRRHICQLHGSICVLAILCAIALAGTIAGHCCIVDTVAHDDTRAGSIACAGTTAVAVQLCMFPIAASVQPLIWSGLTVSYNGVSVRLLRVRLRAGLRV